MIKEATFYIYVTCFIWRCFHVWPHDGTFVSLLLWIIENVLFILVYCHSNTSSSWVFRFTAEQQFLSFLRVMGTSSLANKNVPKDTGHDKFAFVLFLNQIIFSNWKVELEHKNEEASSNDMNSERDIIQDTVKLADPRRLTQVVFLAKFPPWEANRSQKPGTFLEKFGLQVLWPWLAKRKEAPHIQKLMDDGWLIFPKREPLTKALEMCVTDK